MAGHFGDSLAEAVHRVGTPVVVGIDPKWEQLPVDLRPSPDADWRSKAAAVGAFSKGVIDVVAPLVPAVKIQAAFFEELGPAGMLEMASVIEYSRAAGLIVVLDGKRNDIGNTAGAYARAYLGRNDSAWRADAITVNPYLGDDSLTPFMDVALNRGAGVFILAKTSNPGSRVFQDLSCEGAPLYRHVARHIEQLAEQSVGGSGYGSIGAVVGATYPQQLAELRDVMPHAWFLVPGYGSQGGAAADVAPAFDSRGLGAIVNNSRGIIFAHEKPEYAARFGNNWQLAVEAATREMIAALSSVLRGS